MTVLLWHRSGCPAAEPTPWDDEKRQFHKKKPCAHWCGYDKQPKRKFLCPETLVRVKEEDNWCDSCNKSSLWEAPVWELQENGLELWGLLAGCSECKNYVYTNLEGEVVTPTASPIKEKNIDGH